MIVCLSQEASQRKAGGASPSTTPVFHHIFNTCIAVLKTVSVRLVGNSSAACSGKGGEQAGPVSFSQELVFYPSGR